MNASHPLRPPSPRHRVPLWLWVTLSLTTIAAAFAQDSPPHSKTAPSPLETRFREALFAEEGRLDLENAARTYQELLAAFDQDRAIAASALFRLAEVQRKLNQPDAARASLRRLVREFPDREPLARLARENLKALGDPAADLEPGTAPVPSVAADPAAEEENRELARLQEMAKNSPDLLHSTASGPDGKESAMLSALKIGRARVVTFLLNNGGKVDATPENRSYETPANVAAGAGHKTIVELLLDRGAKLESYTLQTAVENKRTTILKLLIERGAQVKGSPWLLGRALHDNYRKENEPDIEIVRLMLDAGISPDEKVSFSGDNHINFGLPFYKGWFAANNLSVQSGRPSGDQLPVLATACAKKRPDIVKLLLEKGADVNAKSQVGSSALELACLFNQPEIVEMLLKDGADAKHIAPGGVRLADIAAHHCSPELYQFLRDAGAEVQGVGPSGKTLWYFMISGQRSFNSNAKQGLEFAAAVVADGVNFNGLNDDEDPLLAAVQSGNLEAVKFFLNAGADVKREGRTPVMVAALRAGLIEKPEERTTVNGSPVTPMAFSASAMDLFRLLLNAGADLNAANPQTERVLRTWGLDFKNVTAFHHLIAASPDMATVEAFLSLDPNPHVLADTLDAAGKVERKCRPVELTEVFNGGILLSNELRRRLWEYTWLEHAPDRAKSVWLNSSSFSVSGFIWQGAFTAAGEAGQALTVAEALAFVFSNNESDDSKKLMMPDFQNLTILRMDPATGKTVSKETVNLQALLERGDASALPVLQPGDILDVSRQSGPSKDYATGWRAFPEPLPGLFRKALTRRVTVKAGDWTRTFQVLPAREDFRWDPATDKLSADCTPASLLRFLPKPEFFYQMNAVTVRQPGKEPVTLDFTNTDANSARLADGAEIVLPAAPADSPELKERLSQGIFISREEDGFLREIFRVKDVPEGFNNGAKALDVLAAAWDEGVWLLPFTDKIIIKKFSSDGTPQVTEEVDLNTSLTGGCVVERPKDTRSDGRIWNIKEWQERLDKDLVEQQVNLVLRNRSEQRITQSPRSAMYSLTEEGWIRQESNVSVPDYVDPGHRAVRMRSRTLEDFLKAVLREMPEKGLVELRRPESLDYLSGEPVWIELEKGIPFLLLNNNDTIILEPDVPLRDLSPPRPSVPRVPQPGNVRRTVVVPTK